jgi:hypothetical protein
MSPESGKKPRFNDSIEEFIRKYRSTPEGRLRWERKCLRNEARGRLDQILSPNYSKGFFQFMAQRILETYGYCKNDTDNLEYSTAHRYALRLMASDLLMTEFYSAEGNLTNFAENNYPEIDPRRFVAIPTTWTATKIMLESKIGVGQDGKNNEYAGHISSRLSTIDENEGDVAAQYAHIFGKENIIALPFAINIYPSSVSVTYQEDFIAPYGGKFASRLIFVPLKDNFF